MARELHDTVAHHVSAIAMRAQAGRVVAATHPEPRSTRSRDRGGGVAALAEMRAMVRLRDGEAADLARSRESRTSSGLLAAWATPARRGRAVR